VLVLGRTFGTPREMGAAGVMGLVSNRELLLLMVLVLGMLLLLLLMVLVAASASPSVVAASASLASSASPPILGPSLKEENEASVSHAKNTCDCDSHA
jgi:hypothetical protein